jgi:hypothetical protein
MARRLDVVLRARCPWGVVSQEHQMAMNAMERPVAEPSLADQLAAMSASWRKNQLVLLRQAARL